MNTDIIVIGGGHAGIEAAAAAAKLNTNVVLITTDKSKIGLTPCNPAIGGPAKGNVVVELEALDGLMPKITDEAMIQIKKLNRSKGPAVQAIRAQIDKEKYPLIAQKYLAEIPLLKIKEDMINEIIIEDGEVKGVKGDKENYYASKIILTTGTYLDSYIIKGSERIFSGPDNIPSSSKLANNLKKLGLNMFRLKTGTPARVKRSSIDFTNIQISPGDEEKISFSRKGNNKFDYQNQEDCYLIYTQPETHKIILGNMDKSPMNNSLIEGVGARYCPSIEDKLNRFQDKDRHQIFLEPEGKNSDSIYVQGFSTSMPDEVQLQMLKSLPGFKNVEILKYGYAIDYEAIYPEQIKNTLETKKIKGLYTAGQVNGTSGYEEAAGQGIIAGINAALKFKGKEEFILTRADSYIGLMIDDLVTKGTEEPYRLLTSRAEYRLMLRNDNADTRLTSKAYDIGLITKEEYQKFLKQEEEVEKLITFAKNKMLSSKTITVEVAKKLQTEELKHGILLYDFIKRPNIKFQDLKEYLDLSEYSNKILEKVEVHIKYEGYIKKIEQEIKKFKKNEELKIPDDFEYDKLQNIALEALEKLKRIKPNTVGQASRISGINPSDINVLIMYIQETKKSN